MTLPDERYQALKAAESLLQDLCDSSKTARVPRVIRQRARSVLRHYPGSHYIEEIARRAPDLITPHIEDLHRFVMRGEITAAAAVAADADFPPIWRADPDTSNN